MLENNCRHAYRGAVVTQAALKLAPMLFVRPGELRRARWADIELDTAEWRFTASKTGTAHIVPLPNQAIEILRDLHPVTNEASMCSLACAVHRGP